MTNLKEMVYSLPQTGRGEGLCMVGNVKTNEVCPECGGSFQETVINHRGVVDLVCHRARPRRYYVDSRGFRDRAGAVGKIYLDRNGKPFTSYLSALRTLETMRREKDEGRFDSSRWSP